MKLLKTLGINSILATATFLLILVIIHTYFKFPSYSSLINQLKLILNNEFQILVMCLAILLIILIFIKLYEPIKKSSLFILKFKYTNLLDQIIVGLFVGNSFYFLITTLMDSLTYTLFERVLLYLSFVYLVLRFSFIKKDGGKGTTSNKIYMPDTAAKTDLLGREGIVNGLKNSISSIEVEGSFVIGMYGKWGEGKTTILNILEEKLEANDEITVIKFDPWYYNSMDAIVSNYFNILCDELGRKHFSPGLIMLISQYRDLLLSSLKRFKLNDIGRFIIPDFLSQDNVRVIKSKIEKNLKKLNQKVVIVIDDLDRMERDEILLVFKLIKLFSDFDNFIYIVAFDKSRINKALSKEIELDDKFIDKIIQVGFEIPKVPESKYRSLFSMLLDRFIEENNIDIKDDLNKLQKILFEMEPLFTDLRKVKRLYNLICMKYSMINTKLNFYDFFVVTVIEYFYPEQFKEIYNNKNKFVYYLSDQVYRLRNDNLNEDRKKYYEEFFNTIKDKSKSRILNVLLSSIFKSIDNFPFYYNLVSDYKNIETIAQMPIEDDRFFDLYFTFEKNNFTTIVERIDRFIFMLENYEDEKDIKLIYKDILEKLNSEENRRLFFENLKGYLVKIPKNKLLILSQVIYVNSKHYSRSSGFFQLSEMKWAEALIADIIKSSNGDIQIEILEDIINNCSDIEFVRGVVYFTKNNVDENFSKIRENCIELFKNKLMDKYIHKLKDIFEENQQYNGVWTLCQYIDDKNIVANYYYNLIENKPENIISFLYTFRGESQVANSEESWTETTFNLKDLDKYFDKDKINDYVQKFKGKQKVLNAKDKEIIALFEDYYSGKKKNDF
jgi:hypothetical protein